MHLLGYKDRTYVVYLLLFCTVSFSKALTALYLFLQNCMLGVDKDQVWMGSEDSVIYIISMVSMVCNRQLTEHRAEVTGLAVDTDKYRY